MSKHSKAMMKTAWIWAEESYCKKRQVGAVIARHGHIIAHGHNGTFSGLPNECEILEPFKSAKAIKKTEPSLIVDCPDCFGNGVIPDNSMPSPYKMTNDCGRCRGLGKLRDIRVTSEFTMHAEANAIQWAAENGVALSGATIYITLSPCVPCAKLIAGVKIKEVFYDTTYKCNKGIEYLKKCGIKVTKLSTLATQ